MSSLEIIFLCWAVLIGGLRAHYQLAAGGSRVVTTRHGPGEALLLVVVFAAMLPIPLVYILTTWVDFANYRLPDTLGWSGVVFLALGLWLFWRSHADLGRFWSTTLQLRDAHRIVDDGVYRFIRHPMYAAVLVSGLGQLMVLQNWIAGSSVLVAGILLMVLRVPREERMMIDHFGSDYLRYQQRTGRILPRPRMLGAGSHHE